jgi:nucleoside-diphosphate-sugar epimerase
MKYFITGATGFIGSHVARLLADEGHQVIALVRDVRTVDYLTNRGIRIALGDITDKESMRAPMRGVDGIFHLAAWYKVGAKNHAQAYTINVTGTRNVMELMQELEIPKGVYTSTLAVNSNTHGRLVDESYRFTGRHLSEYDRTKWLAHVEAAEKFIESGLPLVIVMPGLVYGPGDKSAAAETLKRYLSGKLPMLPKKTAFCWTHVDDVACAHISAMEKGQAGQSYIIAGPSLTLIDALKIAERITGVKQPRLHLPPWLLRLSAFFMSGIEKVLPMPALFSAETLRVSAGVTYIGDSSKARRELGFSPRLLEEGLPPTLAALQKELKSKGRKISAL